MTSSDPYWPQNKTFTKSNFLQFVFWKVFRTLSWLPLSDLTFESPNDFKMTSSDQKWPEIKTFLTNLTLGHAICRLRSYQIWLSSHQTITKGPPNNLKWAILTWKRNFIPLLSKKVAVIMFLGAFLAANMTSFVGVWGAAAAWIFFENIYLDYHIQLLNIFNWLIE